MITLRSDNRILVESAQYTYLSTNYSSGEGTLVVTNTDPIDAGDFILLGEMGQSDAELFKIYSIDTTSGAIVLNNASDVAVNTAHAHPESTKVTVLPYDQIRFFRTEPLGTIADETPTFSDSDPLDSWTQIDPSSYYSIYEDTTNTTGFGWFEYRNTETAVVSDNSNPIIYTGFPDNTVLSVFNDFDSLLNINELKLITIEDKFSWFNEGLALVKNKLNLNNVEYTVSEVQSISIVSGTAEYQLEDDFSDLVEVLDEDGDQIENCRISNIMSYGEDAGNTTKYYIRGRYIGFTPEPDASATYTYRYRASSTRATSLSTYIILPDNMFYAIKDFMMYRAYLKFSNPLATTFLNSFTANVESYIQAAVKRTANKDSWSIESSSNT